MGGRAAVAISLEYQTYNSVHPLNTLVTGMARAAKKLPGSPTDMYLDVSWGTSHFQEQVGWGT